MKYVWEPSDILPGVMACKPDAYSKDLGNRAKWTYMVGFTAGSKKDNLCLISMVDGMVSHTNISEEKIADYFNTSGLMPINLGRYIELAELKIKK